MAGKKETVGERIARLRSEKGVSSRDLSVGVCSGTYVIRIENGERVPSVKVLRRLAEKLGVTVEYLETGSDETATDLLFKQVLTRIEGGRIEITADCSTDGGELVQVYWTRTYDGVTSDTRYADGGSITEALNCLLAHEDAADADEATYDEGESDG